MYPSVDGAFVDECGMSDNLPMEYNNQEGTTSNKNALLVFQVKLSRCIGSPVVVVSHNCPRKTVG